MNLSLSAAGRAVVSIAIALGAFALAPQVASGAVSCAYDAPNHIVNVGLHADDDLAMLKRNADGTIALSGVLCGAARVDNTDTVYVKDFSNGNTRFVLDEADGLFAPGYTIDPGGLGFGEEMSFWVDLGGGDGDTLIIGAERAGASIALGSAGINLDVAQDPPGAAEADLKLSGTDLLRVYGSIGDDTITGQGGSGTGQPYTGRQVLLGDEGNDELRAGDSLLYTAALDAGAGDDTLVAGAKGAQMEGGPGDDTIVGGASNDSAQYTEAPGPVRVDLALAGAQDTGAAGADTITGVEMIEGSNFDDVLLGGAGFSSIQGLDGDDRIDGRGGIAVLVGDGGDDLLRGGADIAYFDGGDGHDTVAFDSAPGPVQVDLGSPAAQDVGGFGDQTLLNVEGLIGSSFGDRLTGTAGPDAIDGGGGGDTIAGGEGADRLGGGAGIDTIDSRDSSADTISCGAGPDNLSTDALDKLAADCLPAPAPVPPAATGDGGAAVPAAAGDGAAAPALAVAVPRQSRRSVLAHGLRVLLRCSTECRASGRLVVARATALRLALGTTAASRRLGRLAPTTLPAATQRAARIRLSRRARAALRRAPAIRATLRARPFDGVGHAGAVVRKRVKLR